MKIKLSRLLALLLTVALAVSGMPALAAEGDPVVISAPADEVPPNEEAPPVEEAPPADAVPPVEGEPPVVEAPPLPPLSIQFNGQLLALTQEPIILQDRVYVPLAALSAAIGTGDVQQEGSRISVTRGDRSVVMTVGSTEATFTADAMTVPLVMDVPPQQIDGEAGPVTYVPLRFAAYALGCAVGWDLDDRTVILLDAEALIDAAMANHQYTYLEKYMAYSRQFSQGLWNMNGTFNANMTVMGMGPLTMEGSMTGVTQDADKMQMDLLMKMDLLAFMESIGETITDEDRVIAESLKNEGIQVDVRGDLTGGLFYLLMTMPEALAGDTGIPADTWLSMDINATLAQAGLDLQSLLDLTANFDLKQLATPFVQNLSLTDRDTDFTDIQQSMSAMAASVADTAFVPEGEGVKVVVDLFSGQGMTNSATCILQLHGDAVVGYSMDLSMALTEDDVGNSGMTGTIRMLAAMDAAHNMTATVSMDLPNLVSMAINIAGAYATGSTPPVTAPPAGAPVVSYEEMMAAAMTPPPPSAPSAPAGEESTR